MPGRRRGLRAVPGPLLPGGSQASEGAGLRGAWEPFLPGSPAPAGAPPAGARRTSPRARPADRSRRAAPRRKSRAEGGNRAERNVCGGAVRV